VRMEDEATMPAADVVLYIVPAAVSTIFCSTRPYIFSSQLPQYLSQNSGEEEEVNTAGREKHVETLLQYLC